MKTYIVTAFPQSVYNTDLPSENASAWEAMFMDDVSGDVNPKYYAVVREDDIAELKKGLKYTGSVLPDDLCAGVIGFARMMNYISQHYPDMYAECVDLYEEVQNIGSLLRHQSFDKERMHDELTEYLSRYVDKEQLTGCVTVRPDFMDEQEEEI